MMRMNHHAKPRRIYYRQIINSTDRPISFYDSNGNIAICDPWCHANLLDQTEALSQYTMVIVEDQIDADANGVPKECAVIAETPKTGRNGIRVSRLIRLYDEAVATIESPRTPKGDTYHI